MSRNTAATDSQFDPWILWVTFRRCWPWAIPAGIFLAGIAAFAVSYRFEPTYKATHLLESSHDFLAFKDVMPEISDLAKTEKQVVLNAVVIDPVLANPQLRSAPSLSDPAEAEINLRKNLEVSGTGAETQMVISYVDTDPKAAADVCNAIAESYLAKRSDLDNSRVSNLAQWLEPEIESWEREVQVRQRSVQELSRANQGYDIDQRGLINVEEGALSGLAKLRSEITSIRVELAVMATQGSQNNPAPTDSQPDQVDVELPQFIFERAEPTENEITASIKADETVRDADAQVRRYKETLTMLEDRDLARINRPHYQKMQQKLEQWTANLEQANTDARQRVIKILNQQADADLERRKVDARNMFAAREAEFDAKRNQAISAEHSQRRQTRGTLSAKLKVLQTEYDQLSEEEQLRRKQIGGSAAELQFAQEELSIATGVLTKLRDRHAAIRTERQNYGAVRTVAAASIPKVPNLRFPVSQMTMAAGAGLFLPFLLGLLWEYRVQRVTSIASVENSDLLAPVIGEVAKMPSGTGAGRNRRIFEESVDALRANLLMSLDTKHIRTIAVTSSISGEGKSSVASQLAIAIAKATGQAVLLIDADLRSPDQHEIFGLELGSGLCGVLSGELDFQDAIDTSLGKLVHVMPAGRLNQSPHRIMNQEAMGQIVERATSAYEHVVIDTAPVLSASETLAVSSAVDATLVCVMRDLSRMENVTRTTRRLEAAGATIAGTVFSGVSATNYASRYGDYRYAIDVGMNK